MWSKDKKSIGIFSADWHLRTDNPVCRTDNFEKTIWKKVEWVIDLAASKQVPVFIAGDLSHRPTIPTGMLNRLIEKVQRDDQSNWIIAVPGQHDLPYNSMKFMRRSSFYTLHMTNIICWRNDIFSYLNNGIRLAVSLTPWGWEPKKKAEMKQYDGCIKILLWHHMVVNENPLWPSQNADKSSDILKQFSQFDLIITGDNHQSYSKALSPVNGQKRLHINPGSIARTTIAQIDFQPCVYEVFSDGSFEIHYIPIEDGVFDMSLLTIRGKDETAEYEITSGVTDMKLDFCQELENNLSEEKEDVQIEGKELINQLEEVEDGHNQ